MKKLLLAALPVAALAILALKPTSDPLAIGASLPKADVKMKDIHGKQVSFNDAKRKNGLLVMFSCNTCPVVKGYQTRTNEICKYALDNNIGVILLNPNEALRNEGDSFEEMQSYAKENGYTWNYVVDEESKMADVFGATRTPECFLFNAEGILVYHGAIDDNSRDEGNVSRQHLKIAIDEANAGKEVTTAKTRSVGCSIKRKE